MRVSIRGALSRAILMRGSSGLPRSPGMNAQAAHNRWVVGSSPTGPTTFSTSRVQRGNPVSHHIEWNHLDPCGTAALGCGLSHPEPSDNPLHLNLGSTHHYRHF